MNNDHGHMPDRDAPAGSHPEAHQHHVDVGAAPPVVAASNRRMIFVAIAVVVLLAILYITALMPRRAMSQQLAAEAAGDSLPASVQVAEVKRTAAGGTIALPGTIQPLHEGAIYARAGGYVKKWHVDIGSVVRAGDILAEIDAPELSQNVEQAKHQLAQVRALQGLARADLARWKELAIDSAVTRQELDQKQAAFEVASANVGAAEANLQRLTDREGYTRVRAPFAGVITARNVDIGALITAAGATSASIAGGDQPGTQGSGSLFRIAETDTVRMFLPVPESYASTMNVGLTAQVTVQELRGKTFTGKIARTSRALDATSRTMQTEVDIANPGFVLLPGMYADVRMQVPPGTQSFVIPATALVVRSDGTQVMTVEHSGGKDVVHFTSVQIGRDYGATIEILGGLDEKSVVVTNPSTELTEGARVTVVATPKAAATPPR